jgi:hypothetical protein
MEPVEAQALEQPGDTPHVMLTVVSGGGDTTDARAPLHAVSPQ